MKKNSLILMVLFALGLSVLFLNNVGKIFAESENSGQLAEVASPSSEDSEDHNQIETEKDDESDLEEDLDEEESTKEADKDLEDEDEEVEEDMSDVAEKVQELLQLKVRGGIGDQVRLIAQEQNQAQNHIREQLGELESKSALLKFLFGPNYVSLKNLNLQLEQNQLRIQQLEQLQSQVSSQADKAVIQGAIEALIQQNTSLHQMILSQEQTRSLLGWFIKLFVQ